MRKLHLALSVADIGASIEDYTRRLGAPPVSFVEGEYALWRTPTLNVSIRAADPAEAGRLRHLGWEDPEAQGFTSEVDCNGITWERFAAGHQLEEIRRLWPGAGED